MENKDIYVKNVTHLRKILQNAFSIRVETTSLTRIGEFYYVEITKKEAMHLATRAFFNKQALIVTVIDEMRIYYLDIQ